MHVLSSVVTLLKNVWTNVHEITPNVYKITLLRREPVHLDSVKKKMEHGDSEYLPFALNILYTQTTKQITVFYNTVHSFHLEYIEVQYNRIRKGVLCILLSFNLE